VLSHVLLELLSNLFSDLFPGLHRVFLFPSVVFEQLFVSSVFTTSFYLARTWISSNSPIIGLLLLKNATVPFACLAFLWIWKSLRPRFDGTDGWKDVFLSMSLESSLSMEHSFRNICRNNLSVIFLSFLPIPHLLIIFQLSRFLISPGDVD
jgi:hypothetical protein